MTEEQVIKDAVLYAVFLGVFNDAVPVAWVT
jgi:hypothetical protein